MLKNFTLIRYRFEGCMISLNDFLSYLKNENLDNLAREEFRMIGLLNSPHAAYYSSLPENERIELLKADLLFFFKLLQDSKLSSQIKKALEKWQTYKLPGTPPDTAPSDLLYLLAAKKLAIQNHILTQVKETEAAFIINQQLEQKYVQGEHKIFSYLFETHQTTKNKLETLNKELQQREERFSKLFNSAVDAIVIGDTKGNIIGWNKAAEAIFGYKTEEIVGKSIREIMPEKYRDAHDAGMYRYLTTGKKKVIGKTVELEGLKKNGEIFPIELSLSTWKTETTEFFSGIIRNISVRKKNEQEIHLFHAISETIANATDFNKAIHLTLKQISELHNWCYGEIWLPEKEFNILKCAVVDYHCDQSMDVFISKSKEIEIRPGEGLPGRIWKTQKAEWLNKDDFYKENFIRYSEAKQAGIKSAFGIPILAKKEVMAVMIFYSYDENLEIKYFSDILPSVTAQIGVLLKRKQAEDELVKTNKELKKAQDRLKKVNLSLEERVEKRTRELSQSEQRFKTLADFIPEIIWAANPEGEADYFNNRWYEFTGLDEQRTKESSWFLAIHPEDLNKFIDTWARSINDKGEFQMEIRLRRSSDGLYRWFLARALPLLDDEGNILKWFGSLTDIHDHKTLDEKKNEFIGMASHELKTPLTSIKAYIQLLERIIDETGTEEARTYIKKTENHIKKLTGLVSELLDVSKIQAGKMEINITEFNFNDLVKEAIESVQHQTHTHKIILETEIAGLTVKGDRVRLEQVFNNYLTNAVKYSPKADKIIVSVKKKGDEIIVSVTDFGIGIPKEKQKFIFDRFYRVEGLAPTYSGLGIGLFISCEILKRHHGRAWVESMPDKGSTFYFSLPVQEQS